MKENKITKFVEEKKEKGKQFYQDHKDEIRFYATITGITVFGIAGTVFLGKRLVKLDGESNELKERILDSCKEKVGMPEWDEERWGDRYRKVEEFANSIGLEDDEEFMIAGKDCYGTEDIVISHMVDGWGVYPPKDK